VSVLAEPSVRNAVPATVQSTDPRNLHRVAKRCLDAVLAALLILVLLPVFAVVAVMVRLSSPGPIIFAQERIGKNGRPFTLYKFRTMRRDSDPAIHRAYMQALMAGRARPEGDAFKLRNDPRLIPVGRILRRSSLDELPQLFNVLRGDMSLVGPRPALRYEVELYSPLERRRLSVKPGLTGLWQVSGRSRLTFVEMVALDLAYIDGWSLWRDLKIIARTPVAVAFGRGAY
jgi:exopolysaccharide biosynthesis polyprenyl glycosylphosphotransferase